MPQGETPSEQHGADSGLVRALGPFDATCVVIGAIIGVGIFFTPTQVAKLAGGNGMALTAWAVGGAIALLGAITFGALGRMYPRTAGQYEILRDSYGPIPAFLFVFCNSTAIQPGAIAIIAFITAQYLYLAVVGVPPDQSVLLTLATIMVVCLAITNAVGVKWGSGIQNATVVAKVATLLAVTILATMAPTPSQAPAAASQAAQVAETAGSTASQAATGGFAMVATLFAAMVPAFFSFGGWQHALWIGGEVREPRRNLPLAIIVGVVLVAAVYLLANWAYLRLLGYEGVTTTEALAADAVAVVWPDVGRRVVAGAVAVSAFGVLNAQLLSGPRLVHGMARDGRFFPIFGRTLPRFHTPAAAIVLLAALGLVLLFAAGKDVVGRLVTGVVMVDSVFFALTSFALIVLRRRQRGPREALFGYPWAPALFGLCELGLVLGSFWDADNRKASQIGAAWVIAGLVVYLLFFWRARTPEPDG
jgi:APA family basic amino acid/polyamine antiporter